MSQPQIDQEMTALHQAMTDFRRAQRSISQLEDEICVSYSDIVDTLEQFNTNNALTLDRNNLDAPCSPNVLRSILNHLKEMSYE